MSLEIIWIDFHSAVLTFLLCEINTGLAWPGTCNDWGLLHVRRCVYMGKVRVSAGSSNHFSQTPTYYWHPRMEGCWCTTTKVPGKSDSRQESPPGSNYGKKVLYRKDGVSEQSWAHLQQPWPLAYGCDLAGWALHLPHRWLWVHHIKRGMKDAVLEWKTTTQPDHLPSRTRVLQLHLYIRITWKASVKTREGVSRAQSPGVLSKEVWYRAQESEFLTNPPAVLM